MTKRRLVAFKCACAFNVHVRLKHIAGMDFISVILTKVNPLSAKFIKWSNAIKQFVGKLPTNCLSVFDHFVGLALKGLNFISGFKISCKHYPK